MPLVVLCGKPQVGKSTVAKELKRCIQQQNPTIEIIIVEEDVMKKRMYSDSKWQASERSKIKHQVEQKLTSSNVIIVDAMNYIKGFRYELFCIAKAQNTTYGVVYVVNEKSCHNFDTPLEINMEVPNAAARWDNPLFTVTPYDDSNDGTLTRIANALLNAPSLKASFTVTKSNTGACTNFVQELERITSSTANEIISAISSGQTIVKINSCHTLLLQNHLSAKLVQRSRRRFVQMALQQGMAVEAIQKSFVQYISSSISS